MAEEHVHVTESSGGNNQGFLLGVVFLVVVLLLLWFYGLPYLNSRGENNSPTIPNQIDVNINDNTK